MKNFKTKAYGATGTILVGKTLEPMEVERTKPEADELLIEVLYCGVCHSDIHQVANDWHNTIYPCVPGHEIIGKVVSAGTRAKRFKAGEIVGVGCMIDSCQECKECDGGDEQFCSGPHGATMTYNGYFTPQKGFNTFGGYSTHVVVNEHFVLKIPKKLNPAAAAPILCAGVTTYSPLKRWNIQRGDRVGIIGIGGLGHMAIMIAKAMGAKVTAITTKKEKTAAAKKLGADEVLISENTDAMEAQELSFDYLLCTIPDTFDINLYVPLLKPRGSLITVGLLGPYKSATDNSEVAMHGRMVGGSLIGGILETQEVLEFCAEHGIAPEIQMIKIQEINDAFEKVKNEEVRFRYVIDMQSLKDETVSER